MSSSKQDRALVPAQANNLVLDSADIVIIGNGIAGLTAALEARELAPDKRIVIITDQIHPTINTPALKQYAIGKLDRDQLLALPAGTERSKRIHIVTARVEEIHARSKYVTLNGNRGFGYGSLLIATGAKPQGLPGQIPGRDFDGVLTLHRLQDYMDLRRRLPEVSEAVVIGGGVHAIETVMNLRYWGLEVHWLIRGSTFMRGILDETASEIILDHIREKGVIIHTQTEIKGVIGRIGMVAGVITNHQEMIPCQLIATCTGTKPVVTLANRSTIPIKQQNGIIVDDKLRTSVRDIYAAGDVAALRNPLTRRYEPRAQWYAAAFQGRIAGAMLTEHKDLASEPFGVQWHATHLGDFSMLNVGAPLSENDNVMTLTDTSQGGYRRLTIIDDRLIGYLSLGSTPLDSLAIKHIIDKGYSIRNITKALLKGQFDARHYLSQMRTQAARGYITTGKLPDLLPAPSTRRLPDTGAELLPSTGELRQETEQVAIPTKREIDRVASRPAPLVEDDIDPFTGNLPAVSQQGVNERQQSLYDDIDPFTGNLPHFEEKASETAIDTRQRRGSLWSYDSDPLAKPSTTPSARKHASGLWAYARQDRSPARGER